MTVLWGKKAYDDLDGIVNYLANLSREWFVIVFMKSKTRAARGLAAGRE